MTIDEALAYASHWRDSVYSETPNLSVILALADEVERLRKSIANVPALNTYAVRFSRGFDDDTRFYTHGANEEPLEWYDRNEVLEALGIES